MGEEEVDCLCRKKLQDGLLTNYEVLQVLQKNARHRKHLARRSGTRNWVKRLKRAEEGEKQLLRYLKETPCVEQTPQMVEELFRRLVPFHLTEAEMVQIANHRCVPLRSGLLRCL